MRQLINLMAAIFAIGTVFEQSGIAEDKPGALASTGIQQRAEDFVYKKTLGTRQVWADVNYFSGWRIQENVYTSQCRLVNPQRVVKVTGTLEDCQQNLKSIREEQKLAPEQGKAVILIHGLLQTSNCMNQMSISLKDSGFVPVEFDYPSTQISIPEAAGFLNKMVTSLEGFTEIHFVAHSMGGLVVRSFSTGTHDQRVKRLVMLGTPNQGAELADITQQVWLVRTASGPGARQLGTRPNGLIKKLPVPNYEFAVIAGARGTYAGWNPLIPGDDDGTVTVASTRLPGAADFGTVCKTHGDLLGDEQAISQTVNFLKSGRLRLEGERTPIPDAKKTDTAQLETSNRFARN